MAGNLCPSEFRVRRQMKIQHIQQKPLDSHLLDKNPSFLKTHGKAIRSPNSQTFIRIVEKITFKT